MILEYVNPLGTVHKLCWQFKGGERSDKILRRGTEGQSNLIKK